MAEGGLSLALVFLTALAVGYSGALMPGPLLTMVIAESAREGARVGPLSMVGHATLELLLLGGLALGLTQALSGSLVSGVVGLLGGSVMLWMGATMVRDSRRGPLSPTWDGESSMPSRGLPARAGEDDSSRGTGRDRTWSRHVFQGALLSFSNPYWSLWWATIGAAYVVSAAAFGPLGIAAFFLGHVTADFTWYGFVSVSVAYGRRFFSAAFYRRMVTVCGVFLVGLALYFIQWGVRAVA